MLHTQKTKEGNLLVIKNFWWLPVQQPTSNDFSAGTLMANNEAYPKKFRKLLWTKDEKLVPFSEEYQDN